MKKILISVSYYTPHISGLTNSIKNLAELLVKDYQITILTTQHDKKLPKIAKENNILIQRIPYLFKLYKGFFMPTFILETSALLKVNDEVIIVLPQVEGLIVAILAKIFKRKIITLYACEVTLPSKIKAKFFEFILRLVHNWTIFLSKDIVTLTSDFAKENTLLRKIKNVQAIFPVIIKPQFFAKSDSRFRKKIPRKKVKVGFIGRVSAEKGIEYLLEAIPFLKKEWGDDFVILIAGSFGVGETEYSQKIKLQILKHQQNVVWLQKLEDNELASFYKVLDVLVLPSINMTEAFGMVQVEAMFWKVPVVASNMPGVRVPIKLTGMGEIVPIKNSEKLAQAIIKVVKNKKVYLQRTNHVIKVFSKQEIFSQWQKLLN